MPFILYKVELRLRILALGLFVFSGTLYASRRKVQLWATIVLREVPQLFGELLRQLRDGVSQEQRIHLYALAIVLILGIVIRIRFLFGPMGIDESYTVIRYASRPIYIALTAEYKPNNHFFHTILVRFAYLVTGDDPWSVRLPALVAGILIIPGTYLLSRIIYNKHAALFAAGLVASSSALIEFSVDARGYTLLTLIFLATVALAFYLRSNNSPAAWILLVILSALGFFTIPIMLYGFGIVFIWLLLTIFVDSPRTRRVELLIALGIASACVVILTVLLYLPVIAISGISPIVDNSTVRAKEFEYFIQSLLLSTIHVWNHWQREVPFVFQIVLAIGFLISLTFHRRIAQHGVPIMLAVVLWIIPILMLQRVVPFVRVWVFLLPIFVIQATAGLTYLFTKLGNGRLAHHSLASASVLTVAIAIYLSLTVVTIRDPATNFRLNQFSDAGPITSYLEQTIRPGDKVVGGHSAVFEYYFEQHQIEKDYLYSIVPDLSANRRLFVVIVLERGDTLASVLERAALLSDYSTPELIRQYPNSELYQMTPLEK